MSKLDDIFENPEVRALLEHKCQRIPKENLNLEISAQGLIDRVLLTSQNLQTVNNLTRLLNSGILAGTGYLSVLAVDQGVEHSALYSFLRNPAMFDPEMVFQFAIQSGVSAVALPYGMVVEVGRKYVDKVPIIAKLNHNELLSVPLRWNQTKFAHVKDAWNLGCIGVGFTVYFGSPDCRAEIEIAREMIHEARELGMLVFCWCYPRNSRFATETFNCEEADDVTSQAIYLGATLGVDFVKQKMPRFTKGFRVLKSEGFEVKVSEDMNKLELTNQIDMVRLQVLHAYSGKVGLLNSGGESTDNDKLELVKTSIINKRAGGRGLMVGRKLFKHSFEEGVKLAALMHEVYLDKRIGLA